MSYHTEEGLVYPHYMTGSPKGEIDTGDIYDNTRLMVGEVTGIVYPSSEESHSKQFIEYTVEVVQTDDGNNPNTRVFRGCSLVNYFGGKADRCEYTLRKDTDSKYGSKVGIGNGSKVLLACVNGQANNAVIIGGVTQLGLADKKDKDSGHHYDWEFNGHRVKVDKDGQVEISYNGPTTALGKPLDPNADEKKVGSKITFDKTGSINIVPAEHDDSKVLIGGENAKENLLLAKTYRDKESSMHQTLQSKLTSIKMEFLQLNLSFTTATTDCTVATITKLAADMTKIGTSMQTLMNAFGEMADAIGDFENSKSDYLSKKNFND